MSQWRKNWRLQFVAPKRWMHLVAKRDLYQTVTDPEQIVQRQIGRFNGIWLKALSTSNFYKDWARKHGLPSKISSVADLKQFPALTKEIIRDHQDQVSRDVANADDLYFVSTGGSTGVPTRFPTTKAEKDIEYANTYLGKSWWGIEPFDQVVQLWGHSHVFGAGWRGKLKELRRRLYDYAIRTHRLNAYNMSENRIRQYAEEIAEQAPEVVIGYTSAVFKVAQYAKTNNIVLQNPKLKGVIVTAETATGADIALLDEIFGTATIIEYGMAETGVVAYSRGATAQCAILWDSFLCHEVDGELLVSTIYDRCFPLINYRTGDLLADPVNSDGSVLRFSNIRGRAQESLTLFAADRHDVYLVSGILIVHIVKAYPGIYSVSSLQVSRGIIHILISAANKVNVDDLTPYIYSILSDEFGPVAGGAISVVRTEMAKSSVAGKDLVVVRTSCTSGDARQ